MPGFRTSSNSPANSRLPTNPILERTQSQWLFTSAELLRSPSILDGMAPTQEIANRSKGVNFITQVGILLKLPQLTLATASVYLHRFFMRHSMVDLPSRPGLHHYSVAATALFLATKVEENCRKMRELVVACCRVAQKQPNLVVDEQSKEYWKWRDTILHNEDILLEALCFDLQLEQPYRILYDLLCHYPVQENKHLRNTSWAFLNDSNLTTMCLLFSPRTIAGSAFYTGARFADLAFPDDEHGRPWWEQLDLDIFEIQQACNLMAEVYENSTLPRQNQKEAYVKEEDSSLFDKTRFASGSGRELSPGGSVGAESQGIKRDRYEFDTGAENVQNGNPEISEPTIQPFLDQLGAPPSPKRQRRNSSLSNSSAAHRATRPSVSSSTSNGRQNNINGIDDVQQRIDEIVNASTTSQVAYPHPPLSRRTSSQQGPQWPGPPLRRRSSSISNKPRPPSIQDDSQMGHAEYRPPVGRQPSYDRPSGERRSSYDPESRNSREYRNDEHLVSQQSYPATFNGDADVDDAEKVDYGSEEGEL